MKYEENRSQVWFKVLNQQCKSIAGEQIEWMLPKGINKGAWTLTTSPLGTLLVRNPKDFMLKINRPFVVEYQGEPIIEYPGIIWVKKFRLVREANNLDLKRFGIYRVFRQKI